MKIQELINGEVIERDMTEQELAEMGINQIKFENNHKLFELLNWFDDYFDKQFKQSQWQKNFKVSPDPYFKDEKGKPRIYADIEELKAQAEIVRETINSLRDEV
jgi:hypothetical protein